ENTEREKFESSADAELSNSSNGADAPAAAFGKIACADFASAGYKNGPKSSFSPIGRRHFFCYDTVISGELDEAATSRRGTE
ncbi:MAG: hypothetical protein MR607_10415, partial [Lachnospiraceae bacterium]|nr:hypothetical protein [Lachnospiraceae bacterium]